MPGTISMVPLAPTGMPTGPVPAGAAAARERALRFGGRGELVGILTEPAVSPATPRPGVIFINAGMVHRVGPNRLYVNLARHLAGRGFLSVRFDLSGIGDSPHRADGLPADESAVQETRAVMAALETAFGVRRFVLAGLCSGAVTAFRSALGDPRVAGAVLLNPQGFHHDPGWNARVQTISESRRYLRRALLSPGSWRRALRGRVDYRRFLRVAASRLWPSSGTRSAATSVADALAGQFGALAARRASLLVVCSEGDVSVEYMRAILGGEVNRGVETEHLVLKVFPRSDHSLTLGASQRALFDLVDRWAADHWR